MSHASASSSPPPRALPSIAAMVGMGRSASRLNAASSRVKCGRPADPRWPSKPFDVRTRRERPIAAAGHDDGSHVPRLEPLRAAPELHPARRAALGDEVQRRVVERQPGDLTELRARRGRSRSRPRSRPRGPSDPRRSTRPSIVRRFSATAGWKPIRSSDVALDVDPRRDLDQPDALVAELEHGAVGDVAHLLATLAGELAVEARSRVPGARTWAGCPRSATSTPPSISSSRPCAVSVPTKLILPVRALMFGKPPGPRTRPSKACTLTLPSASTSANERRRDVEPAAVVEVEHVRLVDHRLVVEAGAALVAGNRHAAEDALLDGQHQLIGDALLPRHAADQLGDAETEVADRAAAETRAASGGR